MSSFYGKGINTESQETFNLHILNGESHVTNEERDFWNDKGTYLLDGNNHTLILSKTTIEESNG